MFLSIIIPAYNESKRIGKTLDEVTNFLSSKDYTYEIIVVNDGSTDNTSDVVKRYLSNPYLRIIDNSQNKGKGYAVKTGMLSSTGKYRLFMDADGSTSIKELENLLPHALEGLDVVISSRRIDGSKIIVDRFWFRAFLSKVFVYLVGIIIPLGVKDTQNGFKLFSVKSVEKIFALQTINGWSFDVEILAIARKLNYKIIEVPISWTDSSLSRMSLVGAVRMLIDLIKIRIHLKSIQKQVI